MADKTINTRLVLRNADISAWEQSEVELLKGEMALARLSGDQSGLYKVRIGVGGKTWNQLSDQGQLIIPAKNVEGLTEAIAALSTSYYSCSDISELSTEELLSTYVEGDIAVEKKDIGETGKQQYCAYRFSKSGTKWMALDGNYSASNVILPSNMTITYDFGKYKIDSGKTSKELTCAGLDVASFINDAFAETKQPTITNPYLSITGQGGTTGEIGTTYTVKGATLSFNRGSYQYGPDDTQVTCFAGVKLEREAKGDVTGAESTTTVDKTHGTLTTISDFGTAQYFLSTSVVYNYKATNGFYSDSPVTPKNNIGGASTKDPIKANTTAITASTTATFTGYYPSYWGFTTSPKSNPTAITANNGNITIDGVTYTRVLNDVNKTSFATSNKWYDLFYMVPACKRSSAGWTGKDANNVDLAVEARTEATVTFMDGQTAKYYVYSVRNAAIYSATTCSMKFN